MTTIKELEKRIDDNFKYVVILMIIFVILANAVHTAIYPHTEGTWQNPCEAGFKDYTQEWNSQWDTVYNLSCLSEEGKIYYRIINKVEHCNICYFHVVSCEPFAVKHMVDVCPSDKKVWVKS
jgi:hypothetical protein